MQIIEVTTEKHAKEFLEFPVRLYKEDKNWIRPLDKDINSVFDHKLNKLFRLGSVANRWLLVDNEGKTIGKIAAFVNEKTKNSVKNFVTGGIGFFDCINDQDAANLLFDTSINWLKERGIEAVDGPINFGERDKWWGLLVDGFTEPNYCMPYNFPYYQALFENYGFKLYFNQYTYSRIVEEPLDPKVLEKAKRVQDNPDFSFKHCKKKDLEMYMEHFRQIYNKAWVKHKGVGEMSTLQVKGIMKAIKPILDEELLWFAYYKGEPAAFFLMLPEMNQIFKHFNGKLNWLNKLRTVYMLWTKQCKRFFGVVFGVIPELQGKGVEAAIVAEFEKVVRRPSFQYEVLEMNWIGDFNPKMMRVAEAVGGKIFKTHITYRYLIDQSIEYNRHPILD